MIYISFIFHLKEWPHVLHLDRNISLASFPHFLFWSQDFLAKKKEWLQKTKELIPSSRRQSTQLLHAVHVLWPLTPCSNAPKFLADPCAILSIVRAKEAYQGLYAALQYGHWLWRKAQHLNRYWVVTLNCISCGIILSWYKCHVNIYVHSYTVFDFVSTSYVCDMIMWGFAKPLMISGPGTVSVTDACNSLGLKIRFILIQSNLVSVHSLLLSADLGCLIRCPKLINPMYSVLYIRQTFSPAWWTMRTKLDIEQSWMQ